MCDTLVNTFVFHSVLDLKLVFIFIVDFDKINLDSNKDVDNDDPETIIHVKLLENTKHWKRYKKRVNAWGVATSKRWRERKEPIFTDKAST